MAHTVIVPTRSGFVVERHRVGSALDWLTERRFSSSDAYRPLATSNPDDRTVLASRDEARALAERWQASSGEPLKDLRSCRRDA